MSHPPHLTSSWSSALIPFCAYKTDLNFSKESEALNGTDFPLCSSFLPTILEGQFCYKLSLKDTSNQGKGNELMFILDYNEDYSLIVTTNMSNAVRSSDKMLNFERAFGNIRRVSAKVQINTLSPHISYGGGILMMSAVKRMTAKEDFLKMPLKERKCSVELYEKCRTRRLLEECGCVPWELSRFQVL